MANRGAGCTKGTVDRRKNKRMVSRGGHKLEDLCYI